MEFRIRKNSGIVLFFLLTAVCFLLYGGKLFSVFAAAEAEEQKIQLFDPETLAGRTPTSVIAFATDMHFDPDAKTGAVNPLYEYNTGITTALLHDPTVTKADYIIFCGDITNAGRKKQHESLVKLLDSVANSGVTIFVIPGNHDIDETGVREFARYYADYGYNAAFSRDSSSLSYSLELPDQFLILLDTGGYSFSSVSADVSEETIIWVGTQLEYAKETGLPVLMVGHYPLITQQYGNDRIQKLVGLLETYDIHLYVCGHMHGRHINRLDKLTELVVEQNISYPCGYALISRYGPDELLYTPEIIDISHWAETDETASPVYADFTSLQEKLFEQRCRKTVEDILGEKQVDPQEFEQAVDFYYQFQLSSISGRLYWDADALRTQGYESFLRIAEGSNYYRWIISYMQAPTPYTAGFYLKGDTIEAVFPGN